MMIDPDFDDYVQGLIDGEDPFGEDYDGDLRRVIAAYQAAIMQLLNMNKAQYKYIGELEAKLDDG